MANGERREGHFVLRMLCIGRYLLDVAADVWYLQHHVHAMDVEIAYSSGPSLYPSLFHSIFDLLGLPPLSL